MFISPRKLVCAALLLFAMNAAFANVIECRNCTYQAMANNVRGRGQGSYLIWNPVNAEIHGFLVGCGPQPIAPNSADNAINSKDADTVNATCYAEDRTVPQSYVDAAANLSSISNATFGTYKAAIEVRADTWLFPGYTAGHTPTANDYVTDVNLRGQLNDKLDEQGLIYAQQNPLLVFLEYAFAQADAALQFTNGLSLTVTVVFPNGSKIKVQMRLQTPAAYIAGTARDDTGQLIPDTNTANNAGRWTYSGGQHDSRDRMYNTMHSLNFILGPPSATYTVINCTWSNGNERLSCVLGH